MTVRRLTNLNITKNNANIVGPSTSPSCTQVNTTCCTCICNYCGSTSIFLTLGCRCGCNKCDTCNCCCCCACCTCNRTTPGGMYRVNKVLDYRSADTWGGTTSTTGPTNGFSTCTGTCYGLAIDFKGFYYRSSGNTRYFAADLGSTGTVNWSGYNTHAGNANGSLGACGWAAKPYWTTEGRDYWCSRHCNQTYWNGYCSNFRGHTINMGPSMGGGDPEKNQGHIARSHSFYCINCA